jgi:sirohydrochlorin ferrochelatase
VTTAILLIAHGSRRQAANADLVTVADQVRSRRPDAIVEIAYLELAEPTIPQGAGRCVSQGAEEVRMLPFFLSPGAHVVEDLEGYRRQFQREHPQVRFVLCPPLGLHPLLMDILMERVEEKLAE